ncbi:MAG: tetratricopeptide repeat protein [Balneolaceae bacterium]
MSLSNKAKNYITKHPKKSAKEIAEKLKLSEEDVQAYKDKFSKPLPLKKKMLFYGITLSIPILFFVLTEVTLRSVDYLGDTVLFMDPEIPSEEYLIPNPNFAARYFFYTNTIPSPSTDVFLREKPKNSYRIFAMGGSSAAGYPYSYNGTFSRVVDDILTDAMPEHNVEVVNVATSAISSYTLYDQVDEIVEQKPDAIMIYAGHNEFYGALGVGSNENLGAFPGFVRFYLKLQRYKTFLFLRDVMVNSGKWLTGFFVEDEMANMGGTLMERIIKSQSIELNSTEHELAMKQFRSNLGAIIEQFGEYNIPVFIGTIASNVKDQPPFVSIESSGLPAAQSVFQEAQALYQAGDTLAAKEKFEFAKDLDGLKFRAPSQINKIIQSLPQEFPNVKIVRAHEDFEKASPDGIIGNSLMLEHLHPNQSGYFLLGRSFSESLLSSLTENGLISPVELNLNTYYRRMYISEFDDRVVHHRLKTLKQGFPFVVDKKITPYQVKYKPEGFIDSLAFMAVHKNKRWDRAKIEVGQFHEGEEQFEKALLEYHGLIRNQPWNDSPYVFAARLYLDRNDFENALPMLDKAYQIAPKEAFVTKMLGAIELNRGNTAKAIQLLEESKAINPKDPQMLYNLSGAYGKNHHFELALEVADEVIKINPDFPAIQNWKHQLTTIINSKK